MGSMAAESPSSSNQPVGNMLVDVSHAVLIEKCARANPALVIGVDIAARGVYVPRSCL